MAIVHGKSIDDAIVDMGKEFLAPFFGADITAQALFEIMSNQKDSGSNRVWEVHQHLPADFYG
ncbi:hypothetical protein LG201_07300 [Methylobacillus gramineus]|uniref:hypothetical protein n=1 Tax=Methylobacillus gramineus TaxID=755169 RepID=UPI001D0018AE|nr:hypothetical protein [Methylobacillus gramineus]MCB5185007.1 hypothetical protein [Methylobacillus gramineus]